MPTAIVSNYIFLSILKPPRREVIGKIEEALASVLILLHFQEKNKSKNPPKGTFLRKEDSIGHTT